MISTSDEIKINKEKVYIFFLNIVVLMLLVIFILYSANLSISANWSKVVTLFSVFLLVYQLFIFLKLKVSYTNYGLWFIILSHIFMFSRVYLNAFGLDENIFWDLLSRYPNELLYRSGLIVLSILQSFFIGFTLKQTKKNSSFDENVILNKDVNTYNAGLILTLMTLPFRLRIDLSSIIQTQSTSSYTTLNAASGISDDISLLFVPGIIYILCSKKFSKRYNFLLSGIVIIYFLGIMILTGDRRYPVTAIISIVLCYMSLYKIKIKFNTIILYSLLGSLLLNLLSVIRNIRRTNLTSIANFFNEHGQFILTNNPILETLSEFGLSFLSVVAIVKNIPAVVPYQNGLSFVGAVPSIIPIGWLFGDFFTKVSISNIVNRIEGYPVGATIFGDIYANFGWLSVLISILMGAILVNIFSNNKKKNINYQEANYFSLFYILINLVRSSFFEIVRPTFMVYIVPLLLLGLLKKKRS